MKAGSCCQCFSFSKWNKVQLLALCTESFSCKSFPQVSLQRWREQLWAGSSFFGFTWSLSCSVQDSCEKSWQRLSLTSHRHGRLDRLVSYAVTQLFVGSLTCLWDSARKRWFECFNTKNKMFPRLKRPDFHLFIFETVEIQRHLQNKQS